MAGFGGKCGVSSDQREKLGPEVCGTLLDMRSWKFILSVMENQKNLWDIDAGDPLPY